MLVPVKQLAFAKQRLAGLLSASQRQALVVAMLEDLLGVLVAQPQLRGVTLLCDDEQLAPIAQRLGVERVGESTLGVQGLNAALQVLAARLRARGETALMVLLGDVPLLEAADIAHLLAAHRDGQGCTLAADRHGLGTNALLLPEQHLAEPFQFHFGEQSCARHKGEALRLGIQTRQLALENVALDIDTTADLRELLHRSSLNPNSRTGQLLSELRAQIIAAQDLIQTPVSAS